MTAERVLRTYLTLTVVSTGASSMIWGINTLFLLDAGLSIGKTFAANAFFTAGMVLFEVPTGVVADTVGRRASYLLGTATLIGTTLAYLALWRTHAPFVLWAVVSMLLGLGFTFFSGATEAWLVDGLHATGYEGSLDAAFAKGQVANGIAMMGGSIGGGVLAQLTNLGMPYVVRALLLMATFVVAWRSMRDIGFTPAPRTSVRGEMAGIVRMSLRHGLLNRRVRWVMLAGPFTAGVSVYGFYAAQPYLLQLYGHIGSYAIAGLSAGIVAGAQIAGGASASYISRLIHDRIGILIAAIVASAVVIAVMGVVTSFGVALMLLMVWGTLFAAMSPVRQAYLNSHIPSAQRATVLSFDSLLGSAGGVVIQPTLGRSADLWGYGPAYLVSAAIQALAVPFLGLARRKSVEGAVDEPLALRA
ncbi:nitrate/nitrite transporter NarK [Kribbella sp. VKM Ac-2571]|uniref:MFS transporter n=1 Tax=Kribbella sp. VKM Ac-2571 TaxID=2512222 RepID=UPI00105B2F1E|nr:MFS transporter [Kribbella sp. VKM Ac-2571]TDO59016.1 nitrate/nitrite transporter NarK [Kribbella sp. VKM Ac-2571]